MKEFQNLAAIPIDDPRTLAGMCVLCKSYDFDNAKYSENCLGCSRYHPDLFDRVVDHREWNISTRVKFFRKPAEGTEQQVQPDNGYCNPETGEPFQYTPLQVN